MLLVALAPLWCEGAQKRKAPRPPDVRILEVVSHRSEGLITVDGRVGNCGARPIAKLTLEEEKTRLLSEARAPRMTPTTTIGSPKDGRNVLAAIATAFGLVRSGLAGLTPTIVNKATDTNITVAMARVIQCARGMFFSGSLHSSPVWAITS